MKKFHDLVEDCRRFFKNCNISKKDLAEYIQMMLTVILDKQAHIKSLMQSDD